jgi:flagellar biosynthesis GTPase FlhF
VPTRVLLEGPAIEPLLAQVRQEYGSGVRIISADKIRSGGFGGFFAKQHYELSVEVPDSTDDRDDIVPRKTTPRPARAEESPPTHTLEQLLERAESRDRITPRSAVAVSDREEP